MGTDLGSLYTKSFFDINKESSTPSALMVLGVLKRFYAVDSVVDFGCGSGAWLAGAEQHGATVLKGYDGPWQDKAALASASIDFTQINMEESLPKLERRYDLAISVEVAEHLSSSRADIFIDTICSASDVVVFSAAIKYQGGTNHINEQPQSYWIKKFENRGYECFDLFRATLWDNEDVKWWFRQNILLFVKKSSQAVDKVELRANSHHLYDVVHPFNYVRKIKLNKEKIAALEKRIAELEKGKK